MGTKGGVGPEEGEFKDTGRKIEILFFGKPAKVPVLKAGRRFFAGETLTMLNPFGYGGTVWSARTLDRLAYNANFRGPGGDGH